MTERRKRSARRQQALAAQKKRAPAPAQNPGMVAVAVVVLGTLYWVANRPKTVESNVPYGANGTAWGPVDAPVTIEEWSDFN